MEQCCGAINKLQSNVKLTQYEKDLLSECTSYGSELPGVPLDNQPIILDKKLENFTMIQGLFTLVSSRILTEKDVYIAYKTINSLDLCYQAFKDQLRIHRINTQNHYDFDMAGFVGFLATIVNCEILNRINKSKRQNTKLCSSSNLKSIRTLLKALSALNVTVRIKGKNVWREYETVSGDNLVLFKTVNVEPPKS